MTTIKSFTSLEQSNKLAEILPLESADMHYEDCEDGFKIHCVPSPFGYEYNIPCWSLAALLGVLPEPYQLTSNKEGKVQLMLIHQLEKDYYDNPIDACVAMIEHLHELNLL